MRLYYIDESEGPRYYVWESTPSVGTICSATSTSGEGSFRSATPSRRTGSFTPVTCWREGAYSLTTEAPTSGSRPGRGRRSFIGGLGRIEDAASDIGGVEVINVCLRKSDVKAYEKVSLDRLLNRINASVRAAGRHAFLIFDEGKEAMITRAYRRLRIFNPVPSRYERWEEGERTRNIPVENVIGGPAFRSSDGDYLLLRWPTSSHTPSSSRRKSPSPGSRTWASTKPSPSSTAPST